MSLPRPRRAAPSSCRRRARRADRHAEDAAAEVLLRRARQRAVRRDHPAARSTTPPAPSGRSSSLHAAEIAAATRRRDAGRARQRHVGEDPAAAAGAARRRHARRFVPFDVDPAVLKDASAAVADEFPGLDGRSPSSATSSSTSARCRAIRRRLVAFLGSTIGNLDPAQRAAFLPPCGRRCDAGDAFLLGTDLVKSTDAAGRRLRRRGRRHGGVQQERARRRSTASSAPTSTSTRSSTSRCGTPSTSGSRCGCARGATRPCASRALDLDVAFARGEQMRTEISAKFRRATGAGRAGRGRAAADQLVDRPGRRLRAVAVGAGLAPDYGGTAASLVCRATPRGSPATMSASVTAARLARQAASGGTSSWRSRRSPALLGRRRTAATLPDLVADGRRARCRRRPRRCAAA